MSVGTSATEIPRLQPGVITSLFSIFVLEGVITYLDSSAGCCLIPLEITTYPVLSIFLILAH